MKFKRWSTLAAVAMCAALAGRADAVDPQYDGVASPYANPGLSFQPGATSLTTPYLNPGSIPGSIPLTAPGNPSLISTQRIIVPSATQIAIGDTSGINPSLRLMPPSMRPPIPGLVPGRPQRWKLGAYSKDTDTGVRIVSIVPNSPAARCGLEANDTIITVNGYQVGYVNGTLFDCATEFERSATPDGWVRVMVQNNRNGRLVNLPIQLTTRQSLITGAITLNDNYPLPPGAYAVVELQEMVRPGAPPVCLARQRVDSLTQFPLQFQVPYDPQQIDPRRSYVLTGRILNDTDLLYSPRNTVQVLNAGANPNQIALAFDRVTSVAPGGTYGPYGQDITLSQVNDLYRQYFDRDWNQLEQNTWQSNLQRGYRMQDVQADLLSQNMLFNQCDRDERVYIDKLHQLMLGRSAKPEEMNYWTTRYDQLGGIRRDVAREFLDQLARAN